MSRPEANHLPPDHVGSVAALLETVVGFIGWNFYGRERTAEFMEDRQALRQAVCRYGAECHRRGWEFQAGVLQEQILRLLHQVRRQKLAHVKHLPTYLEQVVDRHVEQRADFLSAEAKRPGNIVARATARISAVQAIQVQTPAEVMKTIYEQEKAARARRRAAKKKAAVKPTVKAPVAVQEGFGF